MYRSIPQTPSNKRVFGACLLSFMILIAPIASVGAATLRATVPPASKTTTKQATVTEKFMSALEAALFEPAPAPLVPAITATKTDSFPVHPSGQAQPGDQITYDVAVSNSSTDATNVAFNDTIDPNTTLVPGSLKVSPVAAADSYVAEQNVPLSVGAPGVLTNDYGTPAPTAVPIVAGPTTAGGTVTLNADGSFNYTPPSAVFTGADTFTYTATNLAGGGLAPNDTATVTITVDARPTVSSTTPTNGATNQITNTNITVTFSEPVNVTGTWFTISCTGSGAHTAAVSGGTTTYTLNPDTDFTQGETCTVTIVAAQVTDVDTNDPPDVMAADYVFSFSMDAAPSVSSTTPTNGATGVPTNSNVTLNFSESVSLGATPVTISCATSGAHTFVVSASPNTTFTINPNVDFAQNELCTVTVLAAQVSDTDANDPPNNMTADYVFSFTTDAAPSVTSTTPTNGATDQTTNTNITLNFSESVSLGVTPLTISCTTSGAHTFVVSASPNTTFTVNPNVDFAAGETCTVTVLAAQVSDTDTNDPPDNMLANYVFSFSTDAAPTVTTTTPTNGATQVANNTDVSITFSEAVSVTGNWFQVVCGTSGTHDTSNSTVSGGSTTFTINPTDFANGESCTATVFAAQVADQDANDPPDNMAANYVFSFTIDAAPAVTTTVPTNNATDVAQSSTVTINFSENVNVAAGGVTINCGSAVAFTPALPQNNVGSLVLTPTGGLPAGSNCTVTVVAANVTDTDSGDPPDNMTADYVFTFKVKPDAVNDNVQTTTGQTVIGNVSFNTANIPYSATTNDVSANAFTVSAFDGTSANGGTVVMTTSGAGMGQFTYNPSRGFEGADTFNYTISRTDGGGSDTATVTINVTGMIWFIQNGAAACSPQCGRLSNPYPTLAAFNTDNALAGGLNPDDNDNIFVYENAAGYSGAVTLRSGQKLIGQDATATLASIAGVTVFSGSAALPAMNTGAPTTNITSTVTMHNSSTVRGLSINVTGTSSGLVASSKTGLVVNDVATISAVNGPGVAASFTSSSGTFTFTNISASGSAGGLSFASTTSASTVNVNNVTTTSGAAVTTSSTGTTDFTLNDVTSTTGTAVSITTATGDFVFHAINSNGATKGIAVNGATGTFTVNGTTTTDGTGGTIQNATSKGAEFISSNNITLKNMNFTNNGTSQTVAGAAGTCGGNLLTGNNLSCVSQIHLQTVNTVSLTNLNITSGNQMGINGNAVSAFTLANSSVTNNGDEPSENGLTFQNLTGTCSITDTIIQDNFAGQVAVANIANSSTLTLGVTGTRTNNAYPTQDTGTTMIGRTSVVAAGEAGILFNTLNTSTNVNMTLNVTGVVLNNNFPANAVFLNMNSASGALGGTTTNSSFDRNGGGLIIQAQNGQGGSYNVTNSEFYQSDLQSILYSGLNPFNATMTGTVQGNIIGSAAHAFSACTPPAGSNCTGIDVNQIGGTGGFQLKIGGTVGGQGNTVQQFDGNGIRFAANGAGFLQAAVQNNTIQNPAGLSANGIDTNIGTTAGATIVGCFNITGNTVTGTYDNTPGTELGIHTRVRFLSEHRLPGMTGTGAANALTFLTTNNPGAAGKIFTEGAGVPGYQSGAACTTPLLLAEGGVESVLFGSLFANHALPSLGEISSIGKPCSANNPLRSILTAPSLSTTSLNQQQLDSTVSTAIARWSATGLTPQQVTILSKVKFDVADLGDLYLGEASNNRILIDRNAGGKGWFIDPTPADDSEFGESTSTTRSYTRPMRAPAGHVDLLTAIMHELGHRLGLDDTYLTRDRDSLMYGHLTVGERRLPAKGQASSAKPGTLKGSHFLSLSTGEKERQAVTRKHSTTTRSKSARSATTMSPVLNPTCGSGDIAICLGTLRTGRTVNIQFKVTINTPFPSTQVSNQGTVSGSNFSDVLTDDPSVAGAADPTVTPVQTCNPPPVPGNMVAWWSGDNTPRDIAGGHDGTLNGGMGYAAGKVLNGFGLDGTDDYVEAPDHNALDLTTALTIDAWVNPTSQTGRRTIVDKVGPAGTGYSLYIQDSQIVLDAGAANAFTSTGTITIPNGSFSHIAATYDGTTIAIYINGALIPTTTVGGGAPIPANSVPLRIGADQGANRFSGVIDEVEIFNVVLTPAQVLDIYSADAGGKCKPSDLKVTKTHSGSFTQGSTGNTYTITVHNDGPATTSGTTTVTDNLPAGLTATGLSGSGWTCTSLGGGIAGPATLTCTSTAAIAPAADFPAITLTVSVGVNMPSADNVVTVSGGGEMDTSDDTATDPTTLTPSADLQITKTDGTGTEVPGTAVSYTIVVTNNGPSNVTGATVADVFPAAITTPTYTSVAAGGASGNTASGSGNINDTVTMPSGSSITYTTAGMISSSATGSLSNTATVTAPGGTTDPDTANNSATDTDTLTPTADLQITKTDGTGTEVPGTAVSYTIVVTNNGPSNVTGATVADVFPAAITLPTYTSVAGGGATGNTASGSGNINDTVSMPSGSSITYTTGGTISSSATGSLSNTATVTAPGGTTDPDGANNSATDTDTLTPTADLQITKTDGSVTEVPGTTVSYTIVVTNNGPSNVTGATVADVFPAAITLPTYTSVAGGGATGNTASGSGNINDTVSMPSGSSITYTTGGTISSSATGSLSNTATVTAPGGTTDPDGANNSATDTDTLIVTADLQIAKTDGSATEVPGTSVSYTIVVTNNGPSNVTGATVADVFPAAITLPTYTSVAGGGATGNTASGSGNINDTVNMPSGSSITYTTGGTISSSATGSLSNTATVTAPGGVTDAGGNNSATDTDTLTPSADLQIVSKTDAPDPVTAGNNITYTINFINNGPSDAQTVTVTDAVPTNTTFISSSVTSGTGWSTANPAVGGTGNVVFSKGTVAAAETATFQVVVKVNSNTPAATTITNNASAASATTDPTPGNNTGTATTTVNTSADLLATKVDSPDPVVVGGNLTYTITVTNNGSSDAQNLALSDLLPPSTTLVSFTVPAGWTRTDAVLVGGTGTVTATAPTLVAGASAVFTLVVNVNLATPHNTILTNSATATTTTTDPNPVNNTGTTTTTVVGTLALTVNNNGDAADANVGDRICDTDLGTPGDQCTLRAAIQETNAAVTADTIGFSLPANTTITLLSALDDINGDLVITGPASGVTVSGNNLYRVFKVLAGMNVSILNLTIANGRANQGGGIFNSGTLTLSNNTFTGNNAVGGTAEGGAIYSNSGTLTILNSTISGNSANGSGGGLFNGGTSTATLVNVTVTNNRTDADGAAPGPGGGIAQSSSNPVTLRNTIVAGNFTGVAPGTAPDEISGTMAAGSNNNLIGAGGSGGLNNGVNGNQVGVADARLAPLANNGGPTQTHAFLAGSTALDAGDNTTATNAGLTTDQRGPGFTRTADGPDADATATVDIGAFEAQVWVEDIANRSMPEDGTDSFSFNVGGIAPITTVTATSSNTALVPNNPANLNVSGSGSTRTLTINPLANQNGSTTITVTVDSASGSMTDTFVLTVWEVNDAPTAVNDTLSNSAEDSGPRTILASTLTANDSKGPANESSQTLIIKTVGNAVGGTVSIVSGNVVFTPTADYFGPASFDYTVEDNGTTNGAADPKTSGTATASFTITEVNDAPDAVNDSLSSVAEDSGQRTIPIASLLANDTKGPANESGQTLTLTGVSNPVGGTVSNDATNVYFTPAADFNGAASFQYTVTDNGTTNGAPDPKSDTATVSFTIWEVNDAPTANDDALTNIVENSGVRIIQFSTLLSNDSKGPANESGQTLIVKTVGNAVGGTVSIVGNTVRFTPTTNYTGFAHFDYTIEDNGTTNGVPDPKTSAPATAHFNITAQAPIIRFSSANYSVAEGAGFKLITVERSGDTSGAVTVDYASSDHSNPADFIPCTSAGAGFASSRCDFTTAIGTLRFAAGETSKTFNVLISQDNYVEGTETLTLTLSNLTGGAVFGVPSTATLEITDDASEPATNPIDTSSWFVSSQYHDFLNREPDAPGLAFWTDNIEKCNDPARRPAGQTVAQCIDKQRESTAIAFFMSPEFQITGGFVYHLYKGSLTGSPNYDGGSAGRFPTFLEFMHDVSQVSEGIVVNNQISGAVVEANRNRLAAEFVLRPEFVAKYGGLNDTLYVQELFNTTGIAATAAQKQALVDGLGNATETRASVLRKVVDGTVVISESNVQFTTPYGQAFINQENRRLFVYMEYVGYLRRNPDAAGFNFWLGKLNFYNGDPFQAEMVRSFILSPEYRSRFGTP